MWKKTVTLILLTNILSVLIAIHFATTSNQLSKGTLKDLKNQCILTESDLHRLENNDIVVERTISGSFTENNSSEYLLILTVEKTKAAEFHHLAGEKHYFFVVMDQQMRTKRNNVLRFVADAINYHIWRPSSVDRDLLVVSGVIVNAGSEEFLGAVYDPKEWEPLWQLEPNTEESLQIIGTKPYLLNPMPNIETERFLDYESGRIVVKQDIE